LLALLSLCPPSLFRYPLSLLDALPIYIVRLVRLPHRHRAQEPTFTRTRFANSLAHRKTATTRSLQSAQCDNISAGTCKANNPVKIGRAHVCTPVTFRSRMPSSACNKEV